VSKAKSSVTVIKKKSFEEFIASFTSEKYFSGNNAGTAFHAWHHIYTVHDSHNFEYAAAAQQTVSNTDVFPLERSAILQNKARLKERNDNIQHPYQMTGFLSPPPMF
jgi:hypothetical protein